VASEEPVEEGKRESLTAYRLPLFPIEFLEEIERLDKRQFDACWVGLLLDTIACTPDLCLSDMARMLSGVRDRYRRK
jgi:hypothetical protein